MKRRFPTAAGLVWLLFPAAMVPLIGACDQFELNWVPVEDTVSLYSLARPEYIDMPSAFDFYSRRVIVVEQPFPGEPMIFDVAFSELDGEFVFLPAGIFATFAISPGIAVDSSGTPFDELVEAPAGGYVTDAPVPVRTDVVYTVRTRRAGAGCSRYGKFEVLELDSEGLVEFRQVRNNLCNDRELIPPEDR